MWINPKTNKIMCILFKGVLKRHVCDNNILGKKTIVFKSYNFVKINWHTNLGRFVAQLSLTWRLLPSVILYLLIIPFEVFVWVKHKYFDSLPILSFAIFTNIKRKRETGDYKDWCFYDLFDRFVRFRILDWLLLRW